MSNNTNLAFYLAHAQRQREILERFSLKADLLPLYLSQLSILESKAIHS